ncbi:hypothetical protein R1T43_06845 [Alteromonas sp. CI.11.F.A3]|uniref:hypothetical protein n=1 Tax=Alteromonas sp. CI.11.F.A3 TaxID=3079555 RepID=UPI002942076F|nr:hypothetical protein [Alteromonas sp. CI.11.F.A3]WOI38742.1 hypothetical protein R1T43_06845 [Alteromonas sp. CI.11.F.A3]
MKRAILCVYYVPDDMEWMLSLHLKQIRKHSPSGTYKIYAAIIKCSSSVNQILNASPDIKVCEVEAENSHPSKQHSMALTQLMDRAFRDGCEVAFTLDVDSFPIRDDWMTSMETKAAERQGVCAVHRKENGDSFLPHPCGAAILSTFVDKYPFEFYPEGIEDKAKHFLSKYNQRPDSGIGLAYVLWENEHSWSEILRSNHVDLHYMIAGIYGDLIFHLGAGSRRPIFFQEMRCNRIIHLIAPLKGKPLLWRLHSLIERGVEGYLVRRNRKIVKSVMRELTNNADAFIESIR